MGRLAVGGGLEVTFEPVLDEGGFPGVLAGRTACIGEMWVGQWGFLDLLETRLGLAAPRVSAAERAVRLVRQLEDQDGFWRRSFEADRLGTARRLLRDRDVLRLWGWRGEGLSPRLAALAAATEGALPGFADRLEAVKAALARLRPGIEAVRVAIDEAWLPTGWRQVLGALRRLGTRVEPLAPEPSTAAGDLLGARGKGFEPRGDGSLIRLRAHGPLAAADEVAGWLAAMGSTGEVVIVGADELLSQALVRHGLPRPIRRAEVPASVAAVRLVIEAMFRPADPADLFALLALDPGPVPRGVGQKLAKAMENLSGRGSPGWRQALEAGLERIDDEGRRVRVAGRVTNLLEPAARREARVRVAEVRRRLAILAGWARRRGEGQGSLLSVALAAEDLSALLEALGDREIGRVELRRLAGELEPAAALGEPAEVGPVAIGHPGGLLGRARHVIWWDFAAGAARRPERVWLSEAERAAFRDAEIPAPDPAAAARAEAHRWRRPLELASETLVLCSPETDAAGERSFAHPLWDELCAAMPDAKRASRLVRRSMDAVARRRAALRPLPAPRTDWSAGRALALRTPESPSSLERLLGCSFSWALGFAGRVRRRFSPPAAPGAWLYGRVAHAVLAEVFEGGALAPPMARQRAAEVLEARLPSFCEALLLPRYQLERAQLAEAVARSAEELAELIEVLGARVRGTELELAGEVSGLALAGRADLVLSRPGVVIDLKWGKTHPRKRLEVGAALQLAAYAELVGGTPRPAVAYYILQHQRLLTDAGSPLPEEAARVGEHDIGETWRGARAAIEERTAELGRGELVAPGAAGEPGASGLEAGRLSIAAPCAFCELAPLCGFGGPE